VIWTRADLVELRALSSKLELAMRAREEARAAERAAALGENARLRVQQTDFLQDVTEHTTVGTILSGVLPAGGPHAPWDARGEYDAGSVNVYAAPGPCRPPASAGAPGRDARRGA
jgi:hypothetical protein